MELDLVCYFPAANLLFSTPAQSHEYVFQFQKTVHKRLVERGRDLPLAALKLYKASLTIEAENNRVGRAREWLRDYGEAFLFDQGDRLSELVPAHGQIHIIIDCTWNLTCYIMGDPHTSAFKIPIDTSRDVADLKESIKKKETRFSHTEVDLLQLHAVDILADDRLKDSLNAIVLGEPLTATRAISEVFPNVQKGHVYVVVDPPSVRASSTPEKSPSLSPELRKGLQKAWTQEYRGSVHRTLLNNILSDPRKSPYCNTGAIIQSSGYGKSRTVDELAKLVFTIPMNLRAEAETEQGAYPLPDTGVANLMQSMATAASADVVVARLHIFFCNLFSQIAKELDSLSMPMEAEAFAGRWREHLLLNRSKLYSSVIEESKRQWSPGSLLSSANRDAEKVLDVLIESKRSALGALAYLIARIPAIGAVGNPLSIVMYVDEAHELEVSIRASKSTLYDLLNRALSDYGHGFFVLFLSTISRTHQFAPVTKVMSSSMILLPGDPIPSYTEMPFDCHPALSPLSPGTLILEDVQDFGFITRFGRPLFWSMLQAAQGGSPESGPDVKTRTFALRVFALQKLTNSTSVSNLKTQAKLAILDTILNLEYHRVRGQTAFLMADMVSSNMRTAFSAPEHQEYMYTGYPSEPVLADAAMEALFLMERDGRVADAAAELLSSLDAGPTEGTIDMGQRGENVAKMILVRAYMSALRGAGQGQSPFAVNWSSGCSLVAFLQSLTGSDFQQLVLGCKPSNEPNGQPLQDAFAKSWVRFTHFVRAADDGAVTTSAACAAFVRAMSFIGWSAHNLVDFCIPILLDSTKPITEANMSALLVQIKLRSKKGSYHIDAQTVEFFPPPGSPRDYTKMNHVNDNEREQYLTRPYISLVMELGVEKHHDSHPAYVRTHLDQGSVSASRRSSPPTLGVVAHTPPSRTTPRSPTISDIHPRYSLSFYGCTHEVYDCIPKAAEPIYKTLLQLSDMVPAHPRPSSLLAVLRMKPFWRTNKQSYDWFDDSWLPADVNEVKEAVVEEMEEVEEFMPTRYEDMQNLGMDIDQAS